MYCYYGPLESPVIVSRSPSYWPGDIRVLQAIQPKDTTIIQQMKNVIFFATSGIRPDVDKMSGGDLDGDLYLVVWDKRLLRYKHEIAMEGPLNYCGGSPSNQANEEDWLSYVAKWENSLLAQIDSCFYYQAEEHGVKSEQCKELSMIFSRMVDHNPSDIKRLKQISALCPVSNPYNKILCPPENKKPVWEKMRENCLDILTVLKERKTFPSLQDWQDFCESLLYVDHDDVNEILASPICQQYLQKKEIEEIHEMWCRISKGKKIAAAANDVPECTYDCADVECKKRHSSDPVFYQEKWQLKVQEQVFSIIQPIKDEKDRKEKEIERHESLRRKMEEMETQAEEKYEKEKNEVEKLRAPILQVISTYNDIRRNSSLLEQLTEETLEVKTTNKWSKRFD